MSVLEGELTTTVDDQQDEIDIELPEEVDFDLAHIICYGCDNRGRESDTLQPIVVKEPAEPAEPAERIDSTPIIQTTVFPQVGLPTGQVSQSQTEREPETKPAPEAEAEVDVEVEVEAEAEAEAGPGQDATQESESVVTTEFAPDPAE